MLKQMGETISELITDLTSIDPETVVNGLKSVIDGITGALQWIAEPGNQQLVIGGIKAILAGWAGLKLTGTALRIVEVIEGIKNLRGGGGGLGTGTGLGGGAGTAGAKAGWGLFGANGLSALTPLGVLAAGTLPAILANNADYAKSEQKRQARVSAAGLLEGTDESFLTRAANALLLKGGENQDFAEIENLLFGLGDRSDLQKMQLHNMLNGKTSGGNYAWDELMSLWGGEEFDMGRMTQLLDVIAEAYRETAETRNGNSGSEKESANTALTKIPAAMTRAMKGWKIVMDGEQVGTLVAPYVNEQIGQGILNQ